MPEARHEPAEKLSQGKSDAERWLTQQQNEIIKGDWIDPARGRITLGEFLPRWRNPHERQAENTPSARVHSQAAHLADMGNDPARPHHLRGPEPLGLHDDERRRGLVQHPPVCACHVGGP